MSARIVALFTVLLAASAFAQLPSLWDIVSTNPNFSTLTAAVRAAGLEQALRTGGPFTVFAPTNDAFSRLPPALLQYLLQPANQKVLAGVILYHVVAGTTLSNQLRDGLSVPTVEGANVNFGIRQITGSNPATVVTVQQATITAVDIRASNGVAHVIDRVIIPSTFTIDAPQYTIAQLAGRVPELSTLLKAVVAANLAGVLNDTTQRFTVFAPVDSAFTGNYAGLINQPAAELAKVLLYHVVAGAGVYSTQLSDGQKVTTANAGKQLLVQRVKVLNEITTLVNNAVVIGYDVRALNGVVHLIDRVLLPGA